MSLTAKSVVRLNTPTNPRLHGALAEVLSVEEWGCCLRTHAAATGRYRASFDEMELIGAGPAPAKASTAVGPGYTGDPCQRCGSLRCVRSGTCQVCHDCGETSGCS